MRLVATCVLGNTAQYLVCCRTWKASLSCLKQITIVINIFVASVILAWYDFHVQTNHKFCSLRNNRKHLHTCCRSVHHIFKDWTATFRNSICTLWHFIDLYLVIFAGEQETSYFLHLWATFDLLYCTSFYLFRTLKVVAGWVVTQRSCQCWEQKHTHRLSGGYR